MECLVVILAVVVFFGLVTCVTFMTGEDDYMNTADNRYKPCGATECCFCDDREKHKALQDRVAELEKERDEHRDARDWGNRQCMIVVGELKAKVAELEKERDEARQETIRFKQASKQHLGFQKRLERELEEALNEADARLFKMRRRVAELGEANAALTREQVAANIRCAELEKAVKKALRWTSSLSQPTYKKLGEVESILREALNDEENVR